MSLSLSVSVSLLRSVSFTLSLSLALSNPVESLSTGRVATLQSLDNQVGKVANVMQMPKPPKLTVTKSRSRKKKNLKMVK